VFDDQNGKLAITVRSKSSLARPMMVPWDYMLYSPPSNTSLHQKFSRVQICYAKLPLMSRDWEDSTRPYGMASPHMPCNIHELW